MSGYRLMMIGAVCVLFVSGGLFVISVLPGESFTVEGVAPLVSSAGGFLSASSTHVSTSRAASSTPRASDDLPPQDQLSNPPEVIKAVYATGWSMGHQGKSDYLMHLIDETELNAIVIDIKDYTGIVSYHTDIPEVNAYEASERRIPRPNELIKRLHDKGIYVIGRLSVFQDVTLARAREDLAIMSSSTGKIWEDRKGLHWVDQSSRDVWDYNIAIARDALERGFDEINFDYIRFPSDGDLRDLVYPFWDGIRPMSEVMREFFAYTRDQLGEKARLSADLFGLTTVAQDDLGIGQELENALPYFDAIAPMVYPSHYYTGFQGYTNPAEQPYGVVRYSMDQAIQKIEAFRVNASTTPIRATLRPWLQDFDLGADYDTAKVLAQIQAWNDAASSTPEYSSGWMLWNASNWYTKEALEASANHELGITNNE